MKINKKLITSYQDEIHLSHMVIEGTNEEIGYQLGRLAKEVHNICKSSDMDRPVIVSQYDYIKANYPEHYARMIGFAAAYGHCLDDQYLDFSFFGEVPGGTACSAVYYPPAITTTGCGSLSRNLDFSIPSDIRNPSFPFKHSYLVEMHPESGYASISLFCFEVFGLALEGINSEGLTVIHLADKDTQFDHENLATGATAEGFNEFLPVQFLLDTCSTAKEAKEALQRTEHYHVAFATHLLVADKEGNSFVFEYSPDGTNKVFVQGSKTNPQKITNFQLNRLTDERMAIELKSRSSENGL
ncbi:MAG: carcinine hydrolase/isopenicillin-N N-acyltransferase family protein, partial [Xanthomonadales bacterium]|nr:carcinine hydrolase/isopenicillin-N N-acyltransferase family protein [Xanthomonadales bacterium]